VFNVKLASIAAGTCEHAHAEPGYRPNGGITCECGLAFLCRHHHQVKQTLGWALEQPEPGVLIWTTPAGLTRTIKPASYNA
jgi:hypothetical protein